MKSSYIVKYSLLLAGVIVMAACRDKKHPATHATHNKLDTGLTAQLQPVNSQVIANARTIIPRTGTQIYSVTAQGVIEYDNRNETSLAARVSGRIEKLYIRYNYQPVQKGQLIMEIYSPDLAAAQRELLLIARNGSNETLLQAARQKLVLLGMTPEQVQHILATGNILYRIPVYSNASGFILEKIAEAATANGTSAVASATPGNGDMNNMGGTAATPAAAPATATPVLLREGQYVAAGQSLYTIYQAGNLVATLFLEPSLSASVKTGTRLVFYAADNVVKRGTVGLIEPVLQNGRSFTRVRIYLQGKHTFQPGQLVTAAIPVVYEKGWWVPQQAVWQSGNRAYVFRKEQDVLKAAVVQTGVKVEGMVQVLTDISNWQIAADAAYLVDSESFIKTSTNQ